MKKETPHDATIQILDGSLSIDVKKTATNHGQLARQTLPGCFPGRICQETATPPRSGVAVELAVLVQRRWCRGNSEKIGPQSLKTARILRFQVVNLRFWIKMGTLW